MLKPWQIEKSKPILKKLDESAELSIDNDGTLKIGDRSTTIDATTFLYNLQQPRKRLHDPDYKTILENLDISPTLVANADAKQLVEPKVVKKKVTKTTLKQARVEDEDEFSTATEEEKETEKSWESL